MKSSRKPLAGARPESYPPLPKTRTQGLPLMNFKATPPFHGTGKDYKDSITKILAFRDSGFIINSLPSKRKSGMSNFISQKRAA